jgi:hypothetical protein
LVRGIIPWLEDSPSMSPAVLIVVRLLHVVLGVVWVGAVTLVAFFVVPAIIAAGPAGGAVMRQLAEVRRMSLWLMAASAVTLLSGIGLYWHASNGFRSVQWLGSGPGRTFGLGGVLASAGKLDPKPAPAQVPVAGGRSARGPMSALG